MASIHKHSSGRSPYWFASYQTADGKFTLRSTKQTDRSKAFEVALEFERAAKHARSGILTEAQCRKVLSEILEKTTGDSIRHVPTAKFLKEWLDAKEAVRSARTAERYTTTVRLFLDHLGTRAHRPLTAVSPRDVQGFLNTRLKSGAAPKTVSVDAKTLNSAFSRAFKQGLISANPIQAVELPKVVSSERDVFTPAQVALLVGATPSTDWKTCILLGYFTGARLSDCAAMKREHVKLAEGVIDYAPQKTTGTTKSSNRVVVPLHPDLETHLSKLASCDLPQTYLSPSLAGKNSGGAHGLSQTFKAIMRSAGIDTQTAKGEGTRRFSKLSFHSLRHSFNSALANAGASQELRMKLTGHKTTEINTRYTHHELQPLRAAIGKLPSLATP
jgi:integrase